MRKKVGSPKKKKKSPLHLEVQKEKNNWMIYHHYVRREFDVCLELIEKQLKLCRGLSEYPLFVKGLILRHNGDIRKSLKLFQAAVMLNKRSCSNLKQVGRSFHLLGDHQKALLFYKEALKHGPDDQETWYYRGLCLKSLGEDDEAENCFNACNAIQKYEQTYQQLGSIFKFRRSWQEAIDNYKEALEHVPESSELHTDLGLLYLRMRETGLALNELGAANTLDPRNTRTILATGSVFQEHDEYDTALQKYRIAIPQNPNSSKLWNNVGMCFFSKKQYVSAIICLNRAFTLSPLEWIISFNLGIVHLCACQYASAFHYLSSSVSLKNDYDKSFMYLAMTLSKLKDFRNCCNAYEKALKLKKSPITELNYSISLLKFGKIQKAREHYQSFLELFRTFEGGGEMRDVTEVLRKKKLLEKAFQ